MFRVRYGGPAVKGWLGLYCHGASSTRRQPQCVLWTFWTSTLWSRRESCSQEAWIGTAVWGHWEGCCTWKGTALQTLLEWEAAWDRMNEYRKGGAGKTVSLALLEAGGANHSEGSGDQGLKGGIESKSWEVMIFVALCNTATEKFITVLRLVGAKWYKGGGGGEIC